MQEISKEEALKEMRFIFEGYRSLNDCSNPSPKNIKLMQAVEMAIIALEQYQEDKEQQQGDLISREALKKAIEEQRKPKAYSEADERQNIIIDCILYIIDNAPTVCRTTSGGDT